MSRAEYHFKWIRMSIILEPSEHRRACEKEQIQQMIKISFSVAQHQLDLILRVQTYNKSRGCNFLLQLYFLVCKVRPNNTCFILVTSSIFHRHKCINLEKIILLPDLNSFDCKDDSEGQVKLLVEHGKSLQFWFCVQLFNLDWN